MHQAFWGLFKSWMKDKRLTVRASGTLLRLQLVSRCCHAHTSSACLRYDIKWTGMYTVHLFCHVDALVFKTVYIAIKISKKY